MTDTLPESGATSSTNQTPSGGVELGNSAANLGNATDLLQSLVKRIDEIDGRTRSLQGDKDRAVSQVKGDLQKLIGEWEAAKSKGLDVDEFAWRKNVEGFMNSTTQTPPDKTPQGSGTNEAASLAKAIFAEAGLDDTSPEMRKWMETSFSSVEQAVAEASKIVITKLKAPKADTADTVVPTGGSASSSESIDTLLVRWDSAKNNPLSDEYKAVKAELDKRGWQ